MLRKTLAAALAMAFAPFCARADVTVTVVHTFNEDGHCEPSGGVTFDRAGNLFGNIYRCSGHAKGFVYKLTPEGALSVLSDFPKHRDGKSPDFTPIVSREGNLYGVTALGGIGGRNARGTVFEIASNGHFKLLHGFAGSDGDEPSGSLLRDAAHNLYGVTISGGPGTQGVLYRISPDGTYTILHAFHDDDGGSWPASGLAADTAGNLYGTTFFGGTSKQGVIFKLAPNGDYKVLYNIGHGGFGDGQDANGTPVLDDEGNLYGVTVHGGDRQSGTLYKIAPDGTETILHQFHGEAEHDAAQPISIIRDGDTLYGVSSTDRTASGTVFKYSLTTGTLKVLYSFGTDGSLAFPTGELTRGPDGALYGVTAPQKVAGTLYKLEEN